MHIRPGARERQARQTEALLLVVVLLVLFVGAALGLAAKAKDAPATLGAVLDINRADAGQIAHALGVDQQVADRLIVARHDGFADVDALGRVPLSPVKPRDAAAKLRAAGWAAPSAATTAQIRATLHLSVAEAARLDAVRAAFPKSSWERVLGTPLLPSGKLTAAESGLVVRTWRAAATSFLACCGALSLFLITAHFLLRRVHPRADPFLLPLAGLLSVFGLLLLWGIKDPLRDIPSFIAQTEGVVIGGALALTVALSSWMGRLPLHRYGYVYALAAVAGTFLLGVAGYGPAGVRLSVAGVQPVEAVKVLLVFFLAAYLAERGPALNDPLRQWGPFPRPRQADIAPLALLYALPLLLFAIVRDLGPVLILFGAFLMLVYLATGRGAYVGLGAAALLAGAWVGYRLHFGVFATRVDMWLSPWANSHKSGDHLALGLWGMASGGPLGSGIGLGGARFIPRGGSDLAFASIGEESGLIGALVIAVCFLILLARGLRIARRAANDFDRLLAAGLALLLSFQALVILCGCLGLLPLTGITLPLVSYGKSSIVAVFFCIGMLLQISARPAVTAVTAAPKPEFRMASSRLGIVFAAAFVLAVGGRLLWIQALAANAVAARLVRVPDADGIARPHVNPRLLLLAQRIGRGRILDRNGAVLAETRPDGRRYYPLGPATAHVIGYLDPAFGGPTGMESRFDGELRGFDGWPGLVPYWRTKDLPGFTLPHGGDVTLTLDAKLQQAAMQALQAAAASVRDRRTGKPKDRGAAVMLDVGTGGVLAAVSIPTFDPNALSPDSFRALSRNAGRDMPLINRVSGGYYPPGSTFKIVTATSLLRHGQANFTTDCTHEIENVYWHANGGETYARRRIADDETDRPHGHIGLSEAIAQSCNVYYARAALALGPDALRETASAFGFSHLPSLTDFGSSLPDIGYGQGPMLATPLEMAEVAATVASGGKRLQPRYRLDQQPETLSTPLSPDQAAVLTAAMREVTRSGTAAHRFDDLPFAVAGKTGTAQNAGYDRMAHSWFIGFAPASDHPRIAFAVLIENGGYGASTAVPAAHALLHAAAQTALPESH